MTFIRVNKKILCIPPHISVSWKDVAALSSERKGDLHDLHVHLQRKKTLTVPNLPTELLQDIFYLHSVSCELEEPPATFPFPEIKFTTFQHDPEKSQDPNLPQELLKRLESISKAIGLQDSPVLPQPEAGCNCPFCQVARTLLKSSSPAEEEVLPEDLQFTSWIIHPIEENIYKVTHPDAPEEHFQVSLTNPISCSCGSSQCQHIEAVLKS